MNFTGGFVRANGHGPFQNDIAGVNFLLQEKSCYTRFRVPLHDGMIDRGCSPILGQQGSMQIESAQF